jgi:hypothetical protein
MLCQVVPKHPENSAKQRELLRRPQSLTQQSLRVAAVRTRGFPTFTSRRLSAQIAPLLQGKARVHVVVIIHVSCFTRD